MQCRDYLISLTGIILEHLLCTEEERVTTPKVSWLGCVHLGAQPAFGVLVVYNVVKEGLRLRLDGAIVDEDAVGNQSVL